MDISPKARLPLVIFLLILSIAGSIISNLVTSNVSDWFRPILPYTWCIFGVLLLLSLGLSFYIVNITRFEDKAASNVSYNQRLSTLTNSLINASKDVDAILEEMSSIIKQREDKVTNLTAELKKLEAEEQQMKKSIELLSQVQPEAVKALLSLTEPSERRSARRDYLLFIGGIIFSTVISILLRILGLA